MDKNRFFVFKFSHFTVIGPRTIIFKKNLEVIISHKLTFDKDYEVIFDLQTIDEDEIEKISKKLHGTGNTPVVFEVSKLLFYN